MVGVPLTPRSPAVPFVRAPAVEQPSGTFAKADATIRVEFADDRSRVRATLRDLLELEHDVDLVPAATEEVVSSVRPLDDRQPDVLVLDLSLPGSASIATIARLRARSPHTQIVVLATNDDPLFTQRALAAGAIGLLARRSVERELAAAVRAAARGEVYLSAPVAAELEVLHRSLAEDSLTPREVEVLRLIAFGHTSVEIARELAISPRTVETHRGRIHKKLALAGRADLVAYALRRGLLRG